MICVLSHARVSLCGGHRGSDEWKKGIQWSSTFEILCDIKRGLNDVTVDNYSRQENSPMMHQNSFNAIFVG